MSIKSKLKTFFFLDDEIDYEENAGQEEEQSIRSQRSVPSQKQNVVSLQSVQQSAKVVLSEPRVYADAQEIADQLKNRRSVVVNLQAIDREQAKRIVDFLSGTTYALGGDIQRIGTDIFLCTPDNVEVQGNISQLFNASEYEDTRW